MKKNISLTKKDKEKPQKERFYLFVKDQGEGAARTVVIILKIIELIITSIFALCLGIFGPLTLWFGFDDPDMASQPAVLCWLISSVIYIVGTVVVMLGHSKIASCIHGVGAVGTLVTYYNYMLMFADIPDNNGPSVLYMPCLFLTIITVIIMLLINLPKWIEKRERRINAKAPSILGNDRKEDKS